MLLDDSFSALDSKTESQVVLNLLATQGHFRKAGVTVVLTSNSGQCYLSEQLTINDSMLIACS
jgi:ATP-binding cassette, subfamily C (CFTR/MRP), member 1